MHLQMKSFRTPDIDDAKALLDEVNLPISDISPETIKNFIGYYVNGRLLSLGGIELYKEHALLRSLATAASHRGEGLANKVVSALENLASNSGASDLYLLTETAESYFSDRAYVRVSRTTAPTCITNTTQFRELCPGTALLMHKHLGS
jgi:amino-acid N-acetyltransferase